MKLWIVQIRKPRPAPLEWVLGPAQHQVLVHGDDAEEMDLMVKLRYPEWSIIQFNQIPFPTIIDPKLDMDWLAEVEL